MADALNVGLNAARMPLICTLDADSVLETDALLHVVRPLVEQPGLVLAVGGVVRPSNGMRLRRGAVDKLELPRRMIVRAQIVEYLRAFMLGRIGWTTLNGLLVISGAFGAYRRCDVVEVGGLATNSLGQDADLVATLHRLARRKGQRRYQMMVVPQAVCWSEAPERRRDLRRQRRRWSHGMAQVLFRHRRAMLNPRYGRFGLLVLPYNLLFELLGPVVEVLGLPAVLAAWWLDLLNPVYAVAVFLLAFGFGLLISVAAVLADEVVAERYDRWRDLPDPAAGGGVRGHPAAHPAVVVARARPRRRGAATQHDLDGDPRGWASVGPPDPTVLIWVRPLPTRRVDSQSTERSVPMTSARGVDGGRERVAGRTGRLSAGHPGLQRPRRVGERGPGRPRPDQAGSDQHGQPRAAYPVEQHPGLLRAAGRPRRSRPDGPVDGRCDPAEQPAVGGADHRSPPAGPPRRRRAGRGEGTGRSRRAGHRGGRSGRTGGGRGRTRRPGQPRRLARAGAR